MYGTAHHGGGNPGQNVDQSAEFGSAVSAGLNKHLAQTHQQQIGGNN